MCPLTAGDTPSSRDPGNLDPALWPDILAFAALAGRANVGGYGEPLSNQKCLTYLRELDEAGVRICMTTNATMVNEKIARELAAIGRLENVNVSVDSPDPAVYEAIRGGPVDRALVGVRRLVDALGSGRLTVSSVLMRSNAPSLITFPAILAAIGVRKYVLQGLVDYTPNLAHEEIGWSDGLGTFVDRIRSACREAGVELVLELPERTKAGLTPPVQPGAAPPAVTDTRQCFAPWDEPVVDKDGRVFPCCYAMTHGQAVLGDLRTASFDAVWHGSAYADFRRAIVDGRTTPDICRQCTVVPTGSHLYREFSAEIVAEASRLAGRSPMRLAVRNTGAAAWSRADDVHIGTANPRDGYSAFRHPSWIGPNRIGTFREALVPPGAIATFEFPVLPSPAVPAETFQIVVERRGWLPGTQFQLRPDPDPEKTAGAGPAHSRLRSVLRAIGVAR
jgi:radical SAM protein with 4Fe4S-binding SPASM domain